MADKSFTLFELHTHDRLQVGPARLRSGEESETEDRTTAGGDGDTSTARRALAAVAVVGVAVLVARVVRRLLGTDPEEVDLGLDVDDEEEFVESDLGDD